MDQQSRFAMDSALVLYTQATVADPFFLPAHIDYLEVMGLTGRTVQAREAYERRTDLPLEMKQCLVAVAGIQSSNATRPLRSSKPCVPDMA